MEKFIKITVWGENWCDDICDITDSYGYSLDTLIDIREQFRESDYDLSKYYESDVTLKMTYSEAQVGNYPPPNIEVPAYWDWKIVKVEYFKDEPDYLNDDYVFPWE